MASGTSVVGACHPPSAIRQAPPSRSQRRLAPTATLTLCRKRPTPPSTRLPHGLVRSCRSPYTIFIVMSTYRPPRHKPSSSTSTHPYIPISLALRLPIRSTGLQQHYFSAIYSHQKPDAWWQLNPESIHICPLSFVVPNASGSLQ